MKRTSKKHAILSHPYLGAILLMIWGFVFYNFVMTAPGYYISNVTGVDPTYYFAAVGGLLLLLIHKLWFRGEYRGSFRRGTSWQKMILTAIVIYIATDLVGFIMDVVRSGFCPLSITMLGAALMAGFGEEAAFRALPISVMMRSLKDKNTYMPALLVSALCFGGVHLMNLGEALLSTTLLQVVCCIGTGLFFGAVYLRTGSIFLPILLHILHDILSFMVASQAEGTLGYPLTGGEIAENLILCLIQVLLAIWIVRGHKEEIINVWKERWITKE